MSVSRVQFMARGARWCALTGSLLLFAPTAASAQDGPPPAVREAIQAVIAVLESRTDEAIESFLTRRATDEFLAAHAERGAGDHLRSLRQGLHAVDDPGDVSVLRGPDGDDLTLIFGGQFALRLRLSDDGKVALLEAADGPPGPSGSDAPPIAFAWETLDEQLRGAVEDLGFSGVVLARREGRQVLREAYGAADARTGRALTPETIFGIGSTPIDFTVAAAQLLEQRGVWSLDDPVAKHIPGVPADKAGLTLRMILQGRSGLPDFHDDATDWDPDLAWIDRDEAVRRILAMPLLFEPGTDERHSHSAYGLLAAAIELASGRPYREFVREEILEPFGMTRTGFYGETLGLPPEDFAVGRGPSSVGAPNIPPNWGPTSWLVMGSGGMFSTVDDMMRFHDGMARGSTIEDRAGFFGGVTVNVGGSNRGFFYLYARDGAGTEVMLMMNADDRTEQLAPVVRGLIDLAMGR